MKIRRKSAKLPASAAPLYVLGYQGAPPLPEELAVWFDLEYGGPLRIKADPESSGPLCFRAIHGPWEAALRLSIPVAEAEAWQTSLTWGHARAGQVLSPKTQPKNAVDLVLHAARLARGVTLLTGGTAYDVRSHAYLNPSDWQDRPLTQFIARDHVVVEQADADGTGCERFHTRGLTKFGLDELEVFRPLGLSSRPTVEQLAEIAEEIVRLGHVLKVGSLLSLPGLGVTLSVTKHRTVSEATGPVAFREIAW